VVTNLRQSAKVCVLLKFTTYNLQFKVFSRRIYEENMDIN